MFDYGCASELIREDAEGTSHDIKESIKIYRGCMGSGKTYSTLKELSPDVQTLFVAERLITVKEAADNCSHLYEVQNKPTKAEHLHKLLSEGKSCVCTHKLFRELNYNTVKLIADMEVHCVIDENLESTIEIQGKPGDENAKKPYLHPSARQILSTMGVLKIDPETCMVSWDTSKMVAPPSGLGIIDDIYRWATNGVLYWYPTSETDLSGFVVTAFPVKILAAFKSISILCYGFKGLALEGYMKLFDIPYVFDDRFLENEEAELAYLKSRINILDECALFDYLDEEKERLKAPFTMSKTCWDERITDEMAKTIGKKVQSHMQHHNLKGKDSLWTVYEDHRKRVAAGFTARLLNNYCNKTIKDARKGTTKTFASWTMKGTNEYKDRKFMVHLCAPNVQEDLRKFFQSRGVELDRKAYTLELVRQWIMRGVARDRDSEEVMTCMIASKDVRAMVKAWLNGEKIK
jgi:hypothetical protein